MYDLALAAFTAAVFVGGYLLGRSHGVDLRRHLAEKVDRLTFELNGIHERRQARVVRLPAALRVVETTARVR